MVEQEYRPARNHGKQNGISNGSEYSDRHETLNANDKGNRGRRDEFVRTQRAGGRTPVHPLVRNSVDESCEIVPVVLSGQIAMPIIVNPG